MLTVVVCTCNRPEMLEQALLSLSRQTRADLIAKVIVSENGGNRASEAVCSRYPSLPIEYFYQDPPRPITEHIPSLKPSVDSPFIAILHDDDWWLPDHVEASLEALRQGHAVAVFSHFVEANSPRHPQVSSYKAPRVWAASGFDFSREVIGLTRVQNLLIHLLDSSFHYSTFVGDTRCCWQALESALASGNPYDNDRTFPLFLRELGPLVYRPAASVVVRTHPGQDSLDPVYRESGGQMKAATTAWMRSSFPDLFEEAVAYFHNQMKPGLTEQELNGVMNYLPTEQLVALVELCGLDLTQVLAQRLPPAAAAAPSPWQAMVFQLKCRLKPIAVRLVPALSD
ncbi:MAG: glycosyltransferase family A protein [Cyanobacteriota bacterium]|nr:glycosyltransferase family A protein [Cyanobacteriota bacterium]